LSFCLAACAPAGGARPAEPPPKAAAVARPAELEPPPKPAPVFPDDTGIEEAGRAYLDLLVAVRPEEATALGLHGGDAELDDRTIGGHDAATDREEALLKSVEERFGAQLGLAPQPPAKVSPAAKTDLAMLVGALRCDVRRRRVERPLQRRPDVYLEPLDAIFAMTAREYAPAADRARSVLARLQKVPRVVELAKQNLLNPPQVWTEIAIERASSAKSFLDEQRPFLMAALPDDTKGVDAALKGATTAYEDYKRYLQRDVLPRSNGRFAAGRELFEYLLKNAYFLDDGADALLATGKKLFADTNAQMNDLARKIDPKAKGWPELTKQLKAKHPAAEELIGAYKKEVARARAFLADKDAVSFPPGEQVDVVETPVFMRGTLTAAYDQPPPFDAQMTKGFFFVTPVDKSLSKAKQEEMLRENDWADIVDTTVHEAYPGHHLQAAFARHTPSRVRRAFDSAISSEGWALYSEELMAELGYYDDTQRLIQLEWTLVRAARIVIDVGLHVGDMTFDQAVKMLTDDVHLERQLALSEVKRYTESPTQPSAYLLGREMIFALRDRVKKRDGAGFSLKAFHTDLLKRGNVPPPLLAREMFDSR
jgi:uncharacterized protein (DUF885 family)